MNNSKTKPTLKRNQKLDIDFKKIWEKVIKYIKTNILFFTFLLTSIISASLVRIFTLKAFDISPMLADTGFILIVGAIGYFIKPKHQFKYFFIWSIIITLCCFINSMYYSNFFSFVSFSLLKTSSQLTDVSDAVVQNVLEAKDFVFFYQIIAMICLNQYLKRKQYFKKVSKLENGKIRALNTMAVGIIVIGLFISTLTSTDISRLNKQWNRDYIVSKYGILVYQVNDLVATVQAKLNPLFGYDEAVKKFKEFYEEKEKEEVKENKYTNILKGKNIIMIHAESMQTFLLNTSFNGQDVVPNLKKLASEGMYFSNFYAQESVGTSSDSEFTNSSSLLPSSSGTVSISYFDREYTTTQKLLKQMNYYTFSMHGNNCSFWNRQALHKSLGYNYFYCYNKDFVIDDVVGLGLSDKSFFHQAIDKIKKVSEEHGNYFGNLIMLSNHTPFNNKGEAYSDFDVSYHYKDEVTNEEKIAPYMEGTKLGYYFKSAHYADEALGQFVQELEENGLLDNTVLVIYGDHDAKLKKSEYLRFYNYDYKTDSVLDKDDPDYHDIDYYEYEMNRKVPFIIWTNDEKLRKQIQGEQTKVMGMYDVQPTLGNMLGFKNPYALGHDIFSIDNNIVIFSTGNWITDKVYYNHSKGEFKLLDSNTAVNMDELKELDEYAEKVKSISDSIIIYDLIKRSKEDEVVIKENTYEK